VLGDRWLEVVPYVQIFSVLYALGALTSMFPPTTMALGETRLNFLVQFWTIVARIPLILAGLVFGGLYGAALGRLASEVVSGILSLHYMKALLGISNWKQIAAHGVTFASLVAMSAAVLLGQRLIEPVTANSLVQLVVLSSIGGLTYVLTGLAIWLVGGRSGGPVSELISIVMRFMPKGRRHVEAAA
jgi:O-antigen/teichoic acid export membrane protein